MSGLVNRAARLRAEAQRGRAEAEALAHLAGRLVADDDPLPGLVKHVRTTFGLDAVSVLRLHRRRPLARRGRRRGRRAVHSRRGNGDARPRRGHVARDPRSALACREPPRARRVRRAARGGRPRPGVEARGRRRRGAGRGQRPAGRDPRRGLPRPADATGVGESRGQQPAPGRRDVEPGRGGGVPGDDRGGDGPAQLAGRQPARRQQDPDREPPAGASRRWGWTRWCRRRSPA